MPFFNAIFLTSACILILLKFLEFKFLINKIGVTQNSENPCSVAHRTIAISVCEPHTEGVYRVLVVLHNLCKRLKNSSTRFKSYLRSFYILLLAFNASFSFSQTLNLQKDSIDTFNQLSEKYKNTNSDSAYYFANMAFFRAQQMDYALGQIEASNNLGEYYLDQGKYQQAKNKFVGSLSKSKANKMPYLEAVSKSKLAAYYYFIGAYDSALAIIDTNTKKIVKQNSKIEYAKLLNLTSYIFAKKGDYFSALEARYEVLNVRLELGNKDEIAKSYNALGDFFKRQNNYSKALKYYLDSYETSQNSKNIRGEGISLTNAAEIYYRLEDFDKALDFHLRALEKKKENGVLKELGISYNGIGLVYNAKKEYAKSLSYLKKAERLFEETESLPLYAETLYNIAEVKYNLQVYDSAIYYWKETEKIGHEIKNLDLLLNTYNSLSKLYLNVDEDTEDNLRYYYNKYTNLADSLRLEENKSEILALQSEFETALSQERLEKVESEKLQTEQELAKIEIQRLYLFFMFCGALLLIFLVYFYYRKSRKKSSILKKHNLLINEQNNHLKELNKQLEESKAALEKTNATKNKLFAIISHDVRSPLSSLSGLLEVISDNPEEMRHEDINELFLNLKNKVSTVDAFLNNLLGWARIQDDGIKVRATSLDLKEIVGKIIHLYVDQARQKNILIKSNLNIDRKVYADKDMLEFVMRNLLANAIKFTYPENTVEILANEKDSVAEISVKDKGIGMSQEELKHLFDLRQQVNKKGTFSEKGTGLGLILTKEFIEKNNGKLEVVSKEQKGSTFKFTLNLATEKYSRVSQP